MHLSIYDPHLKHELLSESEEQALLRQAKAGDADARERLILLNIKLVRGIVNKYQRVEAGIIADDLMADGILGLQRAIDRYDDAFGTRLSTYATLWIHQSVSLSPFLKTTVHLPEHTAHDVRRLTKAKDDLEQANRPITPQALANATNIDIKEVQRLMHFESEALPHQTLDEYLPDNKNTLLNTIADPTTEDIYTGVEIKMDLDFFLSKLYAEERFIIERSFGIPIKMTHKQIATALGYQKHNIPEKVKTIITMLKTLANALKGNVQQQKKQ